MLTRIILAVRKPALGRELSRILTRPGVLLDTVRDGVRGWRRLTEQPADIIVLELPLVPTPRADRFSAMRAARSRIFTMRHRLQPHSPSG